MRNIGARFGGRCTRCSRSLLDWRHGGSSRFCRGCVLNGWRGLLCRRSSAWRSKGRRRLLCRTRRFRCRRLDLRDRICRHQHQGRNRCHEGTGPGNAQLLSVEVRLRDNGHGSDTPTGRRKAQVAQRLDIIQPVRKLRAAACRYAIINMSVVGNYNRESIA